MKRGDSMLSRLLKAASPAMLVVPAFLFPSDAWMRAAAAAEKQETTGAVDPSVTGSPGAATNEVRGKISLDAAVGPNMLVNDRTLCPNGRGLIQSETSIAVAGNVVVAAFNDSRGVCEPDQHAAIGWGFSLDNGDTWT
ncbi:MAG TPA: hypothetical protein VFV14_11740, partial [Myxococcaceae bacterium]|nr:hypothetical protein [Myxococcaceae bacterium]